MSPAPIRILILGGGFGGVYTARHLERLLIDCRDIEITLVSRDNYFLMTPLLFEAGSGILEPRHAVTPLRALFKRVRFIEAEVRHVDLNARLVHATTSSDQQRTLPYDHLVLALGGVTKRSMIPGSDHALTFKTLADAIFLRNRTIDLFELADQEDDPARRAELLSFIVVGAGLVGVELLGELTSFTLDLCRTYTRLRPQELSFELIEAGPRVMPEMDRDLAEHAAVVLRRRGVRIRTNCPVRTIEPQAVVLDDGQRIAARTIVLAAGVAANPLVSSLNLAIDGRGRVAVDATMRSISRRDVWALGDCAAIPDPQGRPYPPLAQHALREARVLAENIVAALRGRPGRPFVYSTLGVLAALGHYQGVGRIMWLKLRGFAAWWVWRTYYLMQMPRWDRRLRIMLDWTVALFFRHDIVKLDLFGEVHPVIAAATKPRSDGGEGRHGGVDTPVAKSAGETRMTKPE